MGISTVAAAARRHGIGRSIYDYESGRAIRDKQCRPMPPYEGCGSRCWITPPTSGPRSNAGVPQLPADARRLWSRLRDETPA